MALFDDRVAVSLFLNKATPERGWLEGLFQQIWLHGGRFSQNLSAGSWQEEMTSANVGTTTLANILSSFSERNPSARFHVFINDMLIEASLGFSPSQGAIKGGILFEIHWRAFARLHNTGYTSPPPATLPFMSNYLSLLHIMGIVCEYARPLYGYSYYLDRDALDEFVQAEENEKIAAQLQKGQLPNLSHFLAHNLFQYIGSTLLTSDRLTSVLQPGQSIRRLADGGLLAIPILEPFTLEMNQAFHDIESANYYSSVVYDRAASLQERQQVLFHAKKALEHAQHLLENIQQRCAKDNSQEQYAREGLLSQQRVAKQVATLESALGRS
jgi:hypothetical protein